MGWLPVIIIFGILFIICAVYTFFKTNKRIAEEYGFKYFGGIGDYIGSAVLSIFSLFMLAASFVNIFSDKPYGQMLFFTIPAALYPHWHHYAILKNINPGMFNEGNKRVFIRFYIHRELVSFMYIIIWFASTLINTRKE